MLDYLFKVAIAFPSLHRKNAIAFPQIINAIGDRIFKNLWLIRRELIVGGFHFVLFNLQDQ
jgi:hypothetical protein